LKLAILIDVSAYFLPDYDYAKKVEGVLVTAGVRSDENRDAENERGRD